MAIRIFCVFYEICVILLPADFTIAAGHDMVMAQQNTIGFVAVSGQCTGTAEQDNGV